MVTVHTCIYLCVIAVMSEAKKRGWGGGKLPFSGSASSLTLAVYIALIQNNSALKCECEGGGASCLFLGSDSSLTLAVHYIDTK